jgi:hypothetical protein
MSKNSEKAVAKKQETMPAAAMDMSAWGDGDVSAKDIIIPKILCMQGLSDLVADGKAKMGDFVDNLTNEVIGSIDNPVDFVPFHMEKIYIISKKGQGDNRFEFDRIEAEAGQQYPFEEEIGGVTYKYEYTLQFYVLRPEDTSIPYVISFKSTSLKAGKTLATQMYVRNRAAGLVPPAYTMQLTGIKEKGQQGTYIKLVAKQGAKTKPELINECLTWLNAVKSGQAKAASETPSAPVQEQEMPF